MKEPSQPAIHSFIVKIWLEEIGRNSGRIRWHGHITHVPSGERRYLKNLEGIVDFIGTYLERIGVPMGRCYRLRQRFRELDQLAHAQLARFLSR